MKILVVEDDKLSLEYVKVILNKGKYEYDAVGDGDLAFEYFTKNKYDIILMDVQLFILSGVESTKMIREYENENNLSKVKIIAVTASDTKILDGLLKKGFDSYLSKPFTIKELLNVLNETAIELD